MDIVLLIKGVVGLIVVLAVLIMVFLLPAKMETKKKQPKEKIKPVQTKQTREEELSFEKIRSIVKNKDSTAVELEKAIDQLIKHFVKITPKLGIRSHPDFDKYVEIIVYLVRHHNTNKDLILKLDSALTKNNPEYRAELNDTLTKALNSRGG